MQNERDWAIAVVRIATGIVFLAHGSQKVFEYGMAGVSASFGQMGIPVPSIFGPLVALLELVGGIALLLGLLSRWVAALLALEMAVAILKVHLKGGFFLPAGIEFALTMFSTSLAVALAGPGAAAIDHLLFKGGS